MSSERTTLTREQRRSRFWARMAMSWISYLVILVLSITNLLSLGIRFDGGFWNALGTLAWMAGLVIGVVGLVGGFIWRRKHPPL